jgi:hypothetical protein
VSYGFFGKKLLNPQDGIPFIVDFRDCIFDVFAATLYIWRPFIHLQNEGAPSCNDCTIGDRRGVYRVLVGKPKGKRQLGRPRRRWEKNIKKNLHRLFESGNELLGFRKFGEFLDYLRTW